MLSAGIGWEGRVAVDEVVGFNYLFMFLLIIFVIFRIVIAGNKKAPNMEITKQPRSWYSGLCNRWLSLVGVSIHCLWHGWGWIFFLNGLISVSPPLVFSPFLSVSLSISLSLSLSLSLFQFNLRIFILV